VRWILRNGGRGPVSQAVGQLVVAVTVAITLVVVQCRSGPESGAQEVEVEPATLEALVCLPTHTPLIAHQGGLNVACGRCLGEFKCVLRQTTAGPVQGWSVAG